jgi:hypothetical protein
MKLSLHLIPKTLNEARKFQQIYGAEPTLSARQCGERVLRCQIGPAQWNLKLPALLVEETHSLFTAVFFASESFELTTGKRVKGMGYPKLLWLCSTNACSATPFPTTSDIRDLWDYERTRTLEMSVENSMFDSQYLWQARAKRI